MFVGWQRNVPCLKGHDNKLCPVCSLAVRRHGVVSQSRLSPGADRLVGLVVRRPPRERKVPGSNPACAGIFFGVESYQ